MKSDIQFRFARRNGRIVTTDSYEIVTCQTPGCPAQYVTASVMNYDDTVDAFLANPPAPVILLDAPARSDETIRF